MKIFIDATGIINKTDGVGAYSLKLLKAIAEIDESRSYTLFLRKDLHGNHPVFQLEDQHNFTFKKINIPSVGPKKQIYFAWILRERYARCDLLHSLNSELPFLHRRKSIVTIHDLTYVKNPGWLRGAARIKAAYYTRALRHGARKASRIIADSESTRRDIAGFFGVNRDKIKVIYLAGGFGSRMGGNSGDDGRVLRKYAIRKPYFLYLGAKRPHKNLIGLIKAFAIFKRYYDTWGIQLVVAGAEYSKYRAYLEQAEKMGLTENIHFTGFVSEEHLMAVYRQAELFMLVSFCEGFGIPILEAMACGTPVITSKISSMPEVAGDAALLTDPHDPEDMACKMAAIMKSGKLRDDLVKKGFERVREFSWKKTAKETLRLYDEVLSGQ